MTKFNISVNGAKLTNNRKMNVKHLIYCS